MTLALILAALVAIAALCILIAVRPELTRPLLLPEVRRWLYGIGAAIVLLLVGYGVLDGQRAALWGSLLAALLSVAAGNVSDDPEPRNALPEAESEPLAPVELTAATLAAPTSGEWYSGKPAAYAPKGGKTYTHRAELPIVGGLKWVHLDMPASPRLGVKHGGVLLCSLYVALAGKAGTQVWVRAVRKDTNDDTAWLGPVTISAKGTANISHLWSIANPREPIAWDIRATAPITVHNRYSKVALVATR